jgi:hypothetical protein
MDNTSLLTMETRAERFSGILLDRVFDLEYIIRMDINSNGTVNTKQKEGSEFRVSGRVTLTPGDRFRASGGPYYEIRERDGSVVRSRMRDSGPFTFVGWFKQGGRTYLKAFSQEGFTVLNLAAEHRHPDLPDYVKAPYRNIRRVGQTKRERSQQQTKQTTKPNSGKKKPTRARRTLAQPRGTMAAPMQGLIGVNAP